MCALSLCKFAGLHCSQAKVQVPVLPPPHLGTLQQEEVQEGPMPHCWACGQCIDDARKKQWKEVVGCPHPPQCLRDHPPPHWRQPHPDPRQCYRQLWTPWGFHPYLPPSPSLKPTLMPELHFLFISWIVLRPMLRYWICWYRPQTSSWCVSHEESQHGHLPPHLWSPFLFFP